MGKMKIVYTNEDHLFAVNEFECDIAEDVKGDWRSATVVGVLLERLTTLRDRVLER